MDPVWYMKNVENNSVQNNRFGGDAGSITNFGGRYHTENKSWNNGGGGFYDEAGNFVGLANNSDLYSHNHNLSLYQPVLQYSLPSLEALDFYPWQIILIVVYSTTAFVSLGSNALTIVILLRGDHVSTELWKFLLNLSIADISMATFCIPFTYTDYMLGRWIFPHFLCPIISFVQITSVSVSIWTLTAIGVDRYFAIIYPFRSLLWLRQHKFTTIAFIWILGFSVALPEMLATEIIEFRYQDQQYYDCREKFNHPNGSKWYTVFVFMFTFLIPILALIFVYSRICIHLLRNSTTPGNPDQNRDKVCINKKIKVIKMLLTIVILFAVCWFPVHLFQLLVWFHPTIQNQRTKLSYYIYVGSYFVSQWLAMAHSLVNPFVYCFMSDNFRQSLRNTLSKCFVYFKRYENGDDCRDLTIVQSVTMMPTVQSSGTKEYTIASTQLVRINSTTINGKHNGQKINSSRLMDDDFV